MALPKPKNKLKIAIALPAYKRPEYTTKCIKALEEAQAYKNTYFYMVDDGSGDSTKDILLGSKLPNKNILIKETNDGLRNTLIDFIRWVIENDFDMMGVMGNDCAVPKDWLKSMLRVFEISDVGILSPNVYPSNAAYTFGVTDDNLPYRPSKMVGGLWFMSTALVKGIRFERHTVRGIKGAFNILKQIIIENDPKVGWLGDVVVQDIGHWSGEHPDHIRTQEHADYYQEVGRGVAW